MHENIETLRVRNKISFDKSFDEMDREKASQDVTNLREQTNRVKDAIHNSLIYIAGKNHEFAESKSGKPAQARIRVVIHTNLISRFFDAVRAFDLVHREHRGNVKDELEKYLRILNPDVEEEEIELALRTGTENQILQQSKKLSDMSQSQKERLMNEFADLQSRHNNITELANNIDQLSKLYHDLNVLVATQETLLDNVGYNIDETKAEAEKGVPTLVEAQSHHSSVGKKKLIVLTLILILVISVSVPIFIRFVPIWTSGQDRSTTNSSENKSSIESNPVTIATPSITYTNPIKQSDRVGDHTAQAVSAIDVQKLLDASVQPAAHFEL